MKIKYKMPKWMKLLLQMQSAVRKRPMKYEVKMEEWEDCEMSQKRIKMMQKRAAAETGIKIFTICFNIYRHFSRMSHEHSDVSRGGDIGFWRHG